MTTLGTWTRREALLIAFLATAATLGALGRVFDVRWLVVVAAIVAAVATAARTTVQIRKTRLESRQERAALDRRLLVPVGPVNDIDPTAIGVDPAAQTILAGGQLPEYLPRAADSSVREAIESALGGGGRWFIVVNGPSKVGKSRTLFEALRSCASDTSIDLISPVDVDAFRSLLIPGEAAVRSGANSVLWLDDLEPFVNEGLTWQAVTEWRQLHPDGIVLATYGGKGSDLIAGASSTGLATAADEILQHAQEISLAATVPAETDTLRPHVDEAVLESIERHGIAAFLVAGPALQRKLATGRHAPGEPASREGVALVRAAADWARCGRTDALSEPTLRELWTAYLPLEITATDEAFTRSIAWATRPVAGTVALLQPGDGLRAYDYVVRLVNSDPASAEPRDAAWSAAADAARDAHALAVGVAAVAYGRADVARNTFGVAAESAIQELAVMGLINKAITLGRMEKRHAEALVAFDEVLIRFADTDDPSLREPMARALIGKAVALGRLGRAEEELAVLEELIDDYARRPESDIEQHVATALLYKGITLGRLEVFEAALESFDQLITQFAETTNPEIEEVVLQGLVDRGITLGDLERPEDELKAYDEALERFAKLDIDTLPEVLATALFNKGITLSELQRLDEGGAVFDDLIARMVNASQPPMVEFLAKASIAKADVLALQQRPEDALALYDHVLGILRDTTPAFLDEYEVKVFERRVRVVSQLRRPEDELAEHEEFLAIFNDTTKPGFMRVVAKTLLAKALALVELEKEPDAIATLDELHSRFTEEPSLHDIVANASALRRALGSVDAT